MNKLRYRILEFLRVYIHEFRLVAHDGGLILFLTFIPIAYPVIYSLIYNPELVRDVDMVVVDHDRTAFSRDFTRRLGATQETNIIGYAPDLNEARHAMDSHECFAILEIPEGFGRSTGRNETANAVMYCDMSLLLRYRGFLVAATAVSQEMGAEILQASLTQTVPGAASFTSGDADLLPINNISMGDITNGFDSFIMPGVIILILHQCLILTCGMAGGAKRERPDMIGYNPLNYQPSPLMTMLGQMTCYLTLIIVPMIFLVHYVPLIFRFPMAAPELEIFTFLLPMVLSCIALGFCLQGVVLERETIFIIWVVTSVAFLFLSGLTWPRYAMSPFWKGVADIIPGTWGVEGFIKMNANGSTISQVRNCYINLWILTGVYMVGAYLVQRFVVIPGVKERAMARITARYRQS